jgi:hypothetical protein
MPFLAFAGMAAVFTYMSSMAARIALLTMTVDGLLLVVVVLALYILWMKRKT